MDPKTSAVRPCPRPGEAGFTLVEALVAMVVLVFGLIAIANLMVFAASANSVGNAATASAAMASRELDRLKGLPFNHASLAPGGNLDNDEAGYFNEENIAGVGPVHTRWVIEQSGDNQVRFIRLRSEALSPLVRGRSRAEFTTFRTCTSTTIGCPVP